MKSWKRGKNKYLGRCVDSTITYKEGSYEQRQSTSLSCERSYPATRDWDVQLVNQTFWHIDAQRILVIPLLMHDMTNFLAWRHTKNGLFSVRSAYHCEWENQYGNKLANENDVGTSIPNLIWSTVWSLLCPLKVQIFSWRALRSHLLSCSPT